MTLDELDALHAATSPRPWRHQPDGFGGLEIHDSDPQDPAICEANTHDALAIVAIHNAWPAFSARLRAAEAVLRALVACDDAIAAGREPPTSRRDLAAQARATLGERR